MARPMLSLSGQSVQAHDHDRFLTALFAPQAQREGLFALYALNLELAKTPEVTREPLLGQIRLQWWHDAVIAAFDADTPARHALLPPLRAGAQAAGLQAADLLPMIAARQTDLDPEHRFATLGDLEAYAQATGGVLAELAARLLVRDANNATRQAAMLVGTGWALLGLARAVPFHTAKRRLRLPTAVLAAHGVDTAHLFDRHPPHAGLGSAIKDIALKACEYIENGRKLRREINRGAHCSLLPAVLFDNYLKKLHSVGYDPFALRPERGQVALKLRLLFQSLRGRY
jgi:NADH dehydrogenase [ubiquinone] 1 alpha subcomplex assembly factor 6